MEGSSTFGDLNASDFNFGVSSHWVCIVNKPDSKYIEYFDSFGVPPPDSFLEYMRRSNKQPVGTTNEIQNINSDACGWYCVNYEKEIIRRKCL